LYNNKKVTCISCKNIIFYQEKEKQYEYILDDEIEFVQALKMPGSKDSETAKEPSEFEKKKMSIEETKRSLPVFPFKQDLIDAVREHQVHFITVLGIRIRIWIRIR
jgi:hypothetical protein